MLYCTDTVIDVYEQSKDFCFVCVFHSCGIRKMINKIYKIVNLKVK